MCVKKEYYYNQKKSYVLKPGPKAKISSNKKKQKTYPNIIKKTIVCGTVTVKLVLYTANRKKRQTHTHPQTNKKVSHVHSFIDVCTQ